MNNQIDNDQAARLFSDVWEVSGRMGSSTRYFPMAKAGVSQGRKRKINVALLMLLLTAVCVSHRLRGSDRGFRKRIVRCA
jgi:hypothetical protein